MGSTSVHRDKGITNEEFFFGRERNFTVHASGTVHGIFYAAVERQDDPGTVYGYVIKTQWAPRDHFNFTYKDMSETCGPCYYEAPQSVLDALTPTESATALAWRDECAAHQAQRAALRGLHDGDQVTMFYPTKFTNGDSLDTFTVTRRKVRGGSTKVVLASGGRTYNFPNWQDRVMAVTRDGVRTETPAALRKPESVYARAVEDLIREDSDAVQTRYGVGRYAYGEVEWAARQEFRRGECWDRVEAKQAA